MYKNNYKRYQKQKRHNLYKNITIVLTLFIVGFGIAFFVTGEHMTFSSIGIMLGIDKMPSGDNINDTSNFSLRILEPIDKENLESERVPDVDEKISVNAKYVDVSKINDENYVNELLLAFEQKSFNSLVIPMKNADGSFNYISNAPYDTTSFINVDVTAFINHMISEDVYLIADVSMYSDNHYAKNYTKTAVKTNSNVTFYDYMGTRWISPYVEEGHEYLKAILVEIEALGFDEIMMSNFAFPPKGKLHLVDYKETEIVKEDILSVRAKEFKETISDTKLSVSITPFALEEESFSFENIDKLSEIFDMLYFNYIDEITRDKVNHIENKGFISSDANFSDKNYIIK